jgi:hypothetical protein
MIRRLPLLGPLVGGLALLAACEPARGRPTPVH